MNDIQILYFLLSKNGRTVLWEKCTQPSLNLFASKRLHDTCKRKFGVVRNADLLLLDVVLPYDEWRKDLLMQGVDAPNILETQVISKVCAIPHSAKVNQPSEQQNENWLIEFFEVDSDALLNRMTLPISMTERIREILVRPKFDPLIRFYELKKSQAISLCRFMDVAPPTGRWKAYLGREGDISDEET